MPMSDEQLLEFLQRPVKERPVERVMEELRAQALVAYLNSVVYRVWAIGIEEIMTRRDLVRDVRCMERPLLKALGEVETYAQDLERLLSPSERNAVRKTFSSRIQRYSDDWRKKEGYLTDAEWQGVFMKIGERVMIDDTYCPITRQESAAKLIEAGVVMGVRAAA